MANKWTRTAHHGILQSNEIWEGDRRRTSFQVNAPGQHPISPDMVLWGDSDHGVVVGQEVLMPDAPLQAVADCLKRAMDSPAPGGGPPRQPRRIRVCRPEIADAVRPIADSLNIQLEMADSLPFIDDVFRTLEVQFGSPANQGYLDATDVPARLVGELFTAAASFYRARPWKFLSDGDPILLECPEWAPRHRYAIILGASGMVKGLALYESWKDLRRLATLAPEDPRSEDVAAQIQAVALIFTRRRDLGPRRIEEVNESGWALASGNAYPLVLCSGRGRESQWPSPGEASILTAALKVLPSFTREVKRPESIPGSHWFFCGAYATNVAGTTLEVQATFPAVPRPER